MAVGLHVLPPSTAAVGSFLQKMKVTVQVSATAKGLGGRMCYPTAIDNGGRKRIRSEKLLYIGSNRAKLSHKGKNSEFGLTTATRKFPPTPVRGQETSSCTKDSHEKYCLC